MSFACVKYSAFMWLIMVHWCGGLGAELCWVVLWTPRWRLRLYYITCTEDSCHIFHRFLEIWCCSYCHGMLGVLVAVFRSWTDCSHYVANRHICSLQMSNPYQFLYVHAFRQQSIDTCHVVRQCEVLGIRVACYGALVLGGSMHHHWRLWLYYITWTKHSCLSISPLRGNQTLFILLWYAGRCCFSFSAVNILFTLGGWQKYCFTPAKISNS